jgi:uncharacterized phiE125 gp8 family phage protein
MQNIIKDIRRTPASLLTEPVTTAEAKQWCIVDHTNDDALFASLITTARVQVENKIRQCLVEYTVIVTSDIKCPFRFPWGPVRSVTTIERRDGYADDDPDWLTLDNDVYRIDGENQKTLYGLRCGIHKIEYVAGFTGNEGSLPTPANLKNAVLAQVAFLYENRGDNNTKGKFSDVALALLAGSIDYSYV